MPRKALDIEATIECLSILDADGQVDSKHEPDLETEELLTIFRYMLYARRADERFLKMQRQGRIGTFPQSAGHEAVSMGSIFAAGKDDWHVPAYRELAGMLYRGWPLETIILYWNGFEEGASPPPGLKEFPFCVPIASHLPHAVGLGMAMRIKKDQKVVITYFGDGAASEGDCHEAMNFASVFKAPVVFVCLNNQYAISVPLSRQMACKTIAQRAVAYGMPGMRVDGNDVLAVFQATKEAVARARRGEGPTLIEGLTYRIAPHTTSDDPRKYRSAKEEEEWLAKDPLIRFQSYLRKKGLLDDNGRILFSFGFFVEVSTNPFYRLFRSPTYE